MDGEGHLSLGKIPRRGRSTEYPVRVVVYNTNLEILAEIQRTWGGTLSDTGMRNARWKPGLALIWTNAAAAGILAQVAPFLRIKSKQASELLRFHDHVCHGQRTRDRGGHLLPLPKGELRFRRALHQRVKVMNARGPGPEVSAERSETIWDSSGLLRGKPSAEYLAGFVDAEGAIMISKSSGTDTGNPQHRARISVSNTCRSVLEEIQQSYGGILTHARQPIAGWKDAYQLVWTDGRVKELLSVLRPHLRLKRKQVLLMMAFLRNRERTYEGRRRAGRHHDRLPAVVIADRERSYRRMKELNAKGPRVLTPART